MKNIVIKLDAKKVNILIAALFAVEHWEFENTKKPDFSDSEKDILVRYKNRINSEFQVTLAKHGLEMKRELDLTDVFKRREKLKDIEVEFESNQEIEITIKSLYACEIEFADDIFEFCTVTPGGLNWYRDLRIEHLRQLRESFESLL